MAMPGRDIDRDWIPQTMKPLNVLLIHRDSDNYRKLTGWWSYPVPEFAWTTLKVQPNGFVAHPNIQDVDLIVLDDWVWGKVFKGGRPLAYVTVDSARSDEQLSRNLQQARQADLVLVDSDMLNKFRANGQPVRRFAYAVNENLYHPHHKNYDVAFLCWPTPERRAVRDRVEDICNRRGWSFLGATYQNPLAYADALGLARVVVHKSHVEQARSWRVFDVMATNSCLLTNPIPLIDGDGIRPNEHYAEYYDAGDLEYKLECLLTNDTWKQMSETGYQHVLAHHTWKTRAQELRQMLSEELGL